MACGECEWDDTAERAEDAADALPKFKTQRIELLQDIAATIRKNEHVTEKQLAVIENAEEECQ